MAEQAETDVDIVESDVLRFALLCCTYGDADELRRDGQVVMVVVEY